VITSETRSPAPYAVAAVLQSRRRLEQKRDLLDAEHARQSARPAQDRKPPGEVRPPERHGEEEAEGRDRAVDARRLHAGLCLAKHALTMMRASSRERGSFSGL